VLNSPSFVCKRELATRQHQANSSKFTTPHFMTQEQRRKANNPVLTKSTKALFQEETKSTSRNYLLSRQRQSLKWASKQLKHPNLCMHCHCIIPHITITKPPNKLISGTPVYDDEKQNKLSRPGIPQHAMQKANG
jgi:hypothetical protein